MVHQEKPVFDLLTHTRQLSSAHHSLHRVDPHRPVRQAANLQLLDPVDGLQTIHNVVLDHP
jgi:hypothetical protein